MGGCVEKRLSRLLCPARGLTMKRLAVAGSAWAGIRSAARFSYCPRYSEPSIRIISAGQYFDKQIKWYLFFA